MTISRAWQSALWVAEKQVVTRIQPLVQSPILTRYAGAAYSLRQKPWGWCCKACETWVFNQKQCSELQGDFSGVAQVWPQLSEAALTGPLYFPVDFEPKEEGEPGVIQQGNRISAEELEWQTSRSSAGDQTSAREINAPNQTRQTWCKRQGKIRQDIGPTCGKRSRGCGFSSSTSPGAPRKERDLSENSEPRTPTRQDWCQLSDILVQQPQFCMKAKEAALLSWIEKFERFLVPGSWGIGLQTEFQSALLGMRKTP